MGRKRVTPGEPETRAKVVSAAIRLFSEHGVDGVGMREIASAADIHQPTLYHYWKGKEALVADLFQEGYAAYAERIHAVATEHEGNPAQALRAIVTEVCRLYDEDNQLFSFLLLSQHRGLPGYAGTGRKNPLDTLDTVIQAGLTDGVFQGDKALLVPAVTGIFLQTASFVVYGRLQGPLGAHCHPMTDLILKLVSLQGRS